MTNPREQRRQWDTKGNSHYLFLTDTRGGKVNLMEDFSSSHTSKHRTEGQEGSGGTIGRPGDGVNRAQGLLGFHRTFSKQNVKDKHLEEKRSRPRSKNCILSVHFFWLWSISQVKLCRITHQQFLFAVQPLMYRKLSLDCFDTEENFKTWCFTGKFCSSKCCLCSMICTGGMSQITFTFHATLFILTSLHFISIFCSIYLSAFVTLQIIISANKTHAIYIWTNEFINSLTENVLATIWIIYYIFYAVQASEMWGFPAFCYIYFNNFNFFVLNNLEVWTVSQTKQHFALFLNFLQNRTINPKLQSHTEKISSIAATVKSWLQINTRVSS